MMHRWMFLDASCFSVVSIVEFKTHLILQLSDMIRFNQTPIMNYRSFPSSNNNSLDLAFFVKMCIYESLKLTQCKQHSTSRQVVMELLQKLTFFNNFFKI